MPTTVVIEAHLRQNAELWKELSALNDDQTGRAVSEIKAILESIASQERNDQVDTATYDISTCSSSEVRIILSRFAIQSVNVRLVWVPDSVGIELEYSTFVAHFDDFWYPSSDEVWVADDPISFLIELDHEERITFRRFR